MDNTKRIEQARELLTMIEQVDIEDTVAVGELNARWWCLRVDEQFISCKWSIENSALGDCICIKFYHPEAGHGNGFVTLRDFYTHSRDALKAARPEGWIYTTTYNDEGGRTTALSNMNCTQAFYQVRNCIESECLAEFHCIVQTWIYVWENEK